MNIFLARRGVKVPTTEPSHAPAADPKKETHATPKKENLKDAPSDHHKGHAEANKPKEADEKAKKGHEHAKH